jgi:hypothetical protein
MGNEAVVGATKTMPVQECSGDDAGTWGAVGGFGWPLAWSLALPPRPYWKGQIRLALVSIPVEIYSPARSGASVSFRHIHEPSGKPVNYTKSVAGMLANRCPTFEGRPQ